ncbi:MAG: type II toxin-antitoxin system VapC family toxin [Anaerolineales bacterium]|nr:type II toxin-antitoxin system VapC family toxin [Anaerolineales bacterium]
MPIVDASVIVALMNPNEAEHKPCRAWLSQTLLAGEQIVAPAIVLAEVGAALSRGQPDPALAQRAIAFLSQETLIQLQPLAVELMRRAAAIAIENRIRGCDAAYVALAEQLATELVTLDRQQLDRGAAVVTTKRPFA